MCCVLLKLCRAESALSLTGAAVAMLATDTMTAQSVVNERCIWVVARRRLREEIDEIDEMGMNQCTRIDQNGLAGRSIYTLLCHVHALRPQVPRACIEPTWGWLAVCGCCSPFGYHRIAPGAWIA